MISPFFFASADAIPVGSQEWHPSVRTDALFSEKEAQSSEVSSAPLHAEGSASSRTLYDALYDAIAPGIERLLKEYER